MQLSDRDIRDEIYTGGLRVGPLTSWADGDIQPASVELTLDWDDEDDWDWDRPDRETAHMMTLRPGQFRLAHTQEIVTLGAHLAAQLTGKSSWGRLGLAVHSTAGYIDPGFSGQIVLELKNLHHEKPIVVPRFTRIAQLIVSRLSSPALRPYGHPELGSHYMGQRGTTYSYLKQ